MNDKRKQELRFLLATKTPIQIIETRSLIALHDEAFFDDYYTVPELIEQKLVQFIGQKKNQIFLRPLIGFRVSVVGEIKSLAPGEIFRLHLGEDGTKEFEAWHKLN